MLVNPFADYASGTNKATIEPPLGLAYLSAIAKQKGYACDIIDAGILELDSDKVVRSISFNDILFIGISANVVTFRAAVKLAHAIRGKSPDTPIIAGGPHISALPEYCIRKMGADVAVIGEGEETLLDLLQHYSGKAQSLLENIKGIAFLINNSFVKTPPRPLIDNLDTIPFPDISALPNLRKYKGRARKRPVGNILASRGCPYQCIYCNKNIFSARYRIRSPGNILDEIEKLIKESGIRQLDFLDDNLTFNRDHARTLFQGIIDRRFNLPINLQNGVRADNLDKELLTLMKKAGVFKIAFGVESGNPQILKGIRKSLDLDKVIHMTRLAKSMGFIVIGNFMLGFPGETEATLKDTLDFAIKMNPSIAAFNITIPLPGTPLYDTLKSENRLIIDTHEGLATGFYSPVQYFTLPGLEPDKLFRYYRHAYNRFYIRPIKILESLAGIRSLHEILWFLGAAKDVFGQLLKVK